MIPGLSGPSYIVDVVGGEASCCPPLVGNPAFVGVIQFFNRHRRILRWNQAQFFNRHRRIHSTDNMYHKREVQKCITHISAICDARRVSFANRSTSPIVTRTRPKEQRSYSSTAATVASRTSSTLHEVRTSSGDPWIFAGSSRLSYLAHCWPASPLPPRRSTTPGIRLEDWPEGVPDTPPKAQDLISSQRLNLSSSGLLDKWNAETASWCNNRASVIFACIRFLRCKQSFHSVYRGSVSNFLSRNTGTSPWPGSRTWAPTRRIRGVSCSYAFAAD